MKPEDLMLLSAFTRADAGLDHAEAARLRPLTPRFLDLHKRDLRYTPLVTQEGHARIASVVRRIIGSPVEGWSKIEKGVGKMWSVNFGPRWRLSIMDCHYHHPGKWVAKIQPLDEMVVLHEAETASDAAAAARKWALRILVGAFSGLLGVEEHCQD